MLDSRRYRKANSRIVDFERQDTTTFMSPSSILVYGRDPALLDTRRWVLERGGFDVMLTTDPAEVEKLVCDPRVSLLILCHTLTTAECQRITESASTLNPELKQLRMAILPSSRSADPAGSVISVFDGPKALLHAVQQVASPSAASPS